MLRWKSDELLAAALCALVVAVSLPAWTGSWVYDDWLMVGNPSMDGVEDLLAVFGRSSADYLGSNATMHTGAVTYRPLSMLSLIAVQAFAPVAPLLHHAVSLALHLASMLLLFIGLRASAGPRIATLGALTFGLHPLGMEAYGWINGRSDVLACLGVALLSWTLSGAEARRRAWLSGLGALIAALSKEPALIAVLGLALAAFFPPGRTPKPWTRHRAQLGPVLAVAVASTLALAARSVALADVQRMASSVRPMHDLPLALVRLLGVALRSMLVPAPRTMLNLGYELARPMGALEVVLLCAFAVLMAWLAWTRRWRAWLLIASAAATLAPCVFVRHAFWLGCDRYLYMPLLLVCLALSSPELEGRLAALRPAVRLSGATVWLLILSLGSFPSAQTYRSQTAHMLAMIHQRPDDPTGSLVGARWLWHAGDKEGARTLIDRVPRQGLPPPLASQLATRLGEMGRTREALAVVDDMARRHPDAPYVQLDVLAVQLDQGQLSEAATSAQQLRAQPGFCEAARALIEEHLRKPGWSAAQQLEGSTLLVGYSCR